MAEGTERKERSHLDRRQGVRHQLCESVFSGLAHHPLLERYERERREQEIGKLATEAELRAKFVDGPTVTIPAASKFNYSFNPNGATPLQNVGTVFEASRVTDDWGVLEVSSGGVLMRRILPLDENRFVVFGEANDPNALVNPNLIWLAMRQP